MNKRTVILGISAYYHDSAAALLVDGEIVAAAQEERFTRVKGDSSFPHNAINFCLNQADLSIGQVDHVVFYENPYAKFERLLTTYHLNAPFGLSSFLRAMPSWLTKKLWLGQQIAQEMCFDKRVFFCDHHMSHAASAFYPSPFEDAAILTLDGVGEWSTTTFGTGTANDITLTHHIRFPNSLGLLYSTFTTYTGFKINSGEYKLMGLAPYGEPRYVDVIKEKLICIKPDGAIALNQHYFNYVGGLTMFNSRFSALFGGQPREPESLITQREMDIAASIQVVLNEAVMKMANFVHGQTKKENLVLAGGVALNVVATGKLSVEGPFKRLWIQPAAGDAGGALGAALWAWHCALGNRRSVSAPDGMKGSLLGADVPSDSEQDDAQLKRLGAVWETLPEDDLQAKIVEQIEQGKVVAIARGRAEFGPRALGARSILADARNEEMQSRLNLKVKFRESFRPLAPMVLEEDADRYFDIKQESPYMLLVYPVLEEHRIAGDGDNLFGIELLKRRRSTLPAITHVDYSARVQTIDDSRNPFIAGMLRKFRDRTGCSVIVNTSFNVRGEPIVNTVEDAYRCFMATEIDCLVIGNRFLMRERQNNLPLSESDRAGWLRRFDLD